MPRSEAELMIKSINEKVDALNMTTIGRQGQGVGVKEGAAYIIGIIGVISAIVAIFGGFAR